MMSEPIKIEIAHDALGSIIWDNGRISARKLGLAVRLSWILRHESAYPDLKRYQMGIQGRLIAALELLGLSEGIIKVTRTGGEEMLPGTIY